MKLWKRFGEKHPALAQFITFFLISNGVTVLQIILMPLLKSVLDATELIHVDFQVLRLGTMDGRAYYLFDYEGGSIAQGGGGGLAYFLAVELAILAAQIVNFLLQRRLTFRSGKNIWYAAFWYAIAYVCITVVAALAQGWYKEPIYKAFQTWMGSGGIVAADAVTMLINSIISFWVFYPVLKFIFKETHKGGETRQ